MLVGNVRRKLKSKSIKSYRCPYMVICKTDSHFSGTLRTIYGIAYLYCASGSILSSTVLNGNGFSHVRFRLHDVLSYMNLH